MSQQPDNIATINLEPIGGREVTVEEFSQVVDNVLSQIRGLGKNSGPQPQNGNQAGGNAAGKQSPAINYGELKKYAIYAGSGIVGLYLIGKALQ